MVEEVVERWHLDNGHDAGSDDGMDIDSEEDMYSAGGYIADYPADAEDDCESLSDDESETGTDFHNKGEFFLPYDV